MLVVKVLKETTYYLTDENIKDFADHERVSVEDMRDMIDRGEIDVYDIYYYCNNHECEIIDYRVKES